MGERISLRKPDDFHLHVRQGDSTADYLGVSAKGFARGLIMPNTLPPIQRPRELTAYKEAILRSAPRFQPLMTFKLTPELDRKTARQLKKNGAVAAKYYPKGSTTNAEEGVNNWEALYPALEILEEEDIVLSIHGEDPAIFVLDRERAFLPVIAEFHRRFPRLKIINEHLSCRESIDFIRENSPMIAGTLTVHHLLLTLDDILGRSIDPQAFCKPIAKTPEDRESLVKAAVSGEPCFFFGSDSAPHPLPAKQKGAAGIFTAPVALPLLAGIFEDRGSLERLEDFTSRFGAEFYGLPLNQEKLSLEKEAWTVPETIAGVSPFYAGRTLSWQIV